jgi:hypothetical protein
MALGNGKGRGPVWADGAMTAERQAARVGCRGRAKRGAAASHQQEGRGLRRKAEPEVRPRRGGYAATSIAAALRDTPAAGGCLCGGGCPHKSSERHGHGG